MHVNFNDLQGRLGATYQWTGNEQIGNGSQTLVAINDSIIKIDLHYRETISNMYFELKDVNGLTKTTWGYDTNMSMMISIMINMDHELGNIYEMGLIDLKEHTSSSPYGSAD